MTIGRDVGAAAELFQKLHRHKLVRDIILHYEDPLTATEASPTEWAVKGLSSGERRVRAKRGRR